MVNRVGMLLLGIAIFGVSSQLSGEQPDKAEQNGVQPALAGIDGEAIRAHMRFLSDRLLEGRAPDGPGYAIAARYVQTELESMGLKPAGTNGDWYQPVPLRKSVLDSAKSSLVLVRSDSKRALVDGQDYVFSASLSRADSTVEAPVVFVGFGVTSRQQHYDDYAGVEVKGKVVAMIDGAPAKFPSEERAYNSDGIIKARNAVAHGAVGILEIMLPEDSKRYPWAWLVPQIQAGSMGWLEENGEVHNTFPQLRANALLSDQAAVVLFAGAPKTLNDVFAAARAGQPQAFALPLSVRMQTVSMHKSLVSPNIVARLEGSDAKLREQYVVYTAHVDHLGICPPVDGDSVCHGAVDNASGTASVLEIARAYTRLAQAPRRSVLFVFVTGEEMGLLGSDYFAWHPTVPLRNIVANVNVDGAPGIYYAMKDVVPLGSEHTSLGRTVEEAAHELGYSISPDPMPEEVAFIRSDQYSFVLRGVPAVDVTDGVHAVDPKIDGLAMVKKWLVTRYHTPLDSMDQPLDYDSAAKGSRMNFLVGYDVAQAEKTPTWNAGDFFGETFAK
jgi:hypothetical protein